MILAENIKPQEKGKSDFFSYQLYRWARRRPYAMKIWAGTWSPVSGINPGKTVLYIGFDRDGDWIHARQLRNLCQRGANLGCFAYGQAHDTRNWVDVTDEFWKAYFEKGVCAIHGDYAHNWIVVGDKRTCSYCSKVEKKETRQVEKQIWVDERAKQGGE